MKAIVSCASFCLFLLAGCKKDCADCGYYVIPVNITITPTERVVLGKDTIKIVMEIPFKSIDARYGFPLDASKTYPSPINSQFSAIEPNFHNNQRIIVERAGYLKVLTVQGKRVSQGDVRCEWAKTDSSWVVELWVIPMQKFDGIYGYGPGKAQYRAKSKGVKFVPKYVNTPKNWHLIAQRLNWPLSPWENDVFFYVE